MLVKRIGVLSLGKMLGVLYGGIGLLGGLLFAMFCIMAAAIGQQQAGRPSPLFGVVAIVLAPLFYGVAGFIGGILTAALYNVATGVVGGVEIEVGE
jgi:ribose/xylose/arabinose/galactoside ABC-type transport system permease subunit